MNIPYETMLSEFARVLNKYVFSRHRALGRAPGLRAPDRQRGHGAGC